MSDKKNRTKLTLVSNNDKDKNKTKNNKVMGSDLTEKMRGFCHDVVGRNGEKGMSLINAYRNNYNVSENIKPNTLRMLASRLRSKDNIGIFINHLLEQKQRLHRMNEVKLSESKIETILKKIEQMADDTNITDHVRLKALEMLGKNLGIFETNINIQDKRDRTSTEIESELLTKLNTIINK